MFPLLRHPGSAGAQALSRSFLPGPDGPAGAPPGQRLRSGSYMAATKKRDTQDQLKQSVHTFRGTTAQRKAQLPGKGEHPCFSIAAQSPPSDIAHKALSRLTHHLVVAEARNDTQSTTRPRSDQLADRCSCRHAHSLAADSSALGDLAESRVLGGAWSCGRSHDSHAEAWSTSVAICH